MNCQQGIISSAGNGGLLQRRGPDYQGYMETWLDSTWKVLSYSTVLHMRGELCKQPVCNSTSGGILLWNGEVFGGIQVKFT